MLQLMRTSLSIGGADLACAMRRHDLWLFLGWQDIRQRYRRSLLGPLWLTLSTGIQIGALGFLWAKLFGQSLGSFFPYFATGVVLWTFLSGVLLEACTGFTQFEGIIRQVKLPFCAFLLRILWRHVIILGHNLIIIVVVLVIFRTPWSAGALLAVAGLRVFVWVAWMCAGPIAVFCTRFRDAPQIFSNLINIFYYLTPIMWTPASLHGAPWVYQDNPLYHLFELVRAPLLGQVPAMGDYAWAGAIVAITAIGFLVLLGRYSHRIAYWL